MILSRQVHTVAVIPAFNEEKTIAAVVQGVLAYVSEVIVVDDCSTDATLAEAQRVSANVLHHEINSGYDASLNDGFALAVRHGAEIIITFDADGEHDSHDIPHLLTSIIDGVADIVIGQRLRTMHAAEKILAWYTRLRWGIKDPLCGLKAYRREVYEAVGYFDSLQSIGTELLCRGLSMGFRVTSVPISMHSRNNDTSRFYARSFQANIKILKAMMRIRKI